MVLVLLCVCMLFVPVNAAAPPEVIGARVVAPPQKLDVISADFDLLDEIEAGTFSGVAELTVVSNGLIVVSTGGDLVSRPLNGSNITTEERQTVVFRTSAVISEIFHEETEYPSAMMSLAGDMMIKHADEGWLITITNVDGWTMSIPVMSYGRMAESSHDPFQVEGGSSCGAGPCPNGGLSCSQDCPPRKACISYCKGQTPVCYCGDIPDER
ncbi:MAG: hypothetical protein ACXAC5_01000 [Promethearchaeota archaeon]